MSKRRNLPSQYQTDVVTVSTMLADARDEQLELVASPDLKQTDRTLAAKVLGLIIAALALTKEVNGGQENHGTRTNGPG